MAAIRMSNEVTTRMRACRYALSAFFTEGAEQVANLLLGKTQPNLGEGEEPPGFAGVINALGQTLRAALNRLVSADLALYAALTFEAGLRKQRGLKIDDLAFQLVGMRRTIVGQYVEPDLDPLRPGCTGPCTSQSRPAWRLPPGSPRPPSTSRGIQS